MIPYTMVRFPIGGAMDTKTDPAALSSPGLAHALNCWMDRSGALSKRYGYITIGTTLDVFGSTVPAFTALAGFEDTFVAFSTDSAYVYLETPGRYTGIGPGVSLTLSVTDLSALSSASVLMVDHVSFGNYTMYAQAEQGNVVRWILWDDRSATIIASEDISTATNPRVVSRGNLVYVFYASTAATQLRVRLFDFTSLASLTASMAAAPVTVATDLDNQHMADCVANSTHGIFVAYVPTTANTVKYGFVNASGALVNTGTFATAAADPQCVSCAVAPNLSAHGIVYARDTAPNDVYAVLLSFNGSVWSTTSTSGAIDTAVVSNITCTACAWESNNTTLTLWYTDEPVGLQTHQGSYTTGGVATARAFTVYRARLAGKPFKYNTVWYAPFLVAGTGLELQSSVYIISVDGVALSGRPISGTPVATIAENASIHAANRGNFFGQTTAVASTGFRLAFTPRLTPGNVATSLATLRRSTSAAAYFDFASADNHKTVRLGENLYIGGAVLLMYDGGPNGIYESGFLRIVESGDIVATPGTSGSLTASSQYNYHVIPEHLDAHGVREQGTNTGPKVVTLAAGQDDVTLTIPTIATSLKADRIVFAIYRTEANGSVYYRVGHVANNPLTTTVAFVDTTADADIVTNESFPYTDGTLLDNTPPPAGHVIGVSSNRLFIAAATTRGLIYASKTREPGLPVEFNDALTIQLPEDTGDVMALADLNNSLIAFTERAIYRIAGEGPSNTGEGQWLSPEKLTGDTGCTNQRSVVETPMGLMFRGLKGFYLLDVGFQLQYIGSPLENIDDDPPGVNVSGVLCPDRHQVRFSDNDHPSVVYDYFHRQWYQWSWLWDGPSVVVDGNHYTATGSATVYREDFGTYADAGNAYTMSARLAPFKNPTGINGDIRVRRVGVVGAAQGAFTLTALTHVNFATTTTQTKTWTIAGAGQFSEDTRITPTILRGLALTISDGGVANGGMRLQEVAVEIGQRQAGKAIGR